MSGNSLANYIYSAKLPPEELDVAFSFIEVKANDFINDAAREDK